MMALRRRVNWALAVIVLAIAAGGFFWLLAASSIHTVTRTFTGG